MDVSLAAGVRAPREGPMSERDLQTATVEEQWPELRHLLALRNRVGRDEADPRRFRSVRRLRPPHVVAGATEPRRHVVERPAAGAERSDAAHLRPLLGRLVLGPAERRIAEDERALAGPQHVGPVDLQRVGVADVGRLLYRDPRVRLAEFHGRRSSAGTDRAGKDIERDGGHEQIPENDEGEPGGEERRAARAEETETGS